MPRFLALCLAFAIGSGACSRPSEPTSDPTATSRAPLQASAATPGNAVVVGRASRGAIVMLEPTTPRDFPMPVGSVVMDQYGRAFVPEVLIARKGQIVEFRNSEDILHNVIVIKQPTGRAVFDISRPPFEMYEHTFEETGVYAVSCDIHPGMRAALVVSSTPYVTVADASGAFTFPDVVPGAYTVVVSGEGQNTERPVDVTAPSTEVNLTNR